jgi:hypothetical protein
MSPRTCIVSVKGPSGVTHSVEVIATSVYEAAALGFSVLQKADWSEPIAPGTPVDVEVREISTHHRVTIQQIQRWCDGVAVSPDEVLKRKRVKELLSR